MIWRDVRTTSSVRSNTRAPLTVWNRSSIPPAPEQACLQCLSFPGLPSEVSEHTIELGLAIREIGP